MEIEITGVHHIMITVGDLDVAKNFYGSILGLKEKPIPPQIEGERVWYYLGPLQLHVNVLPEYKVGLSHFAITIDEGKYEEYIQYVSKSGYENMSKSKMYEDGMRRVYINDPFGNNVEIIDGQMGD